MLKLDYSYRTTILSMERTQSGENLPLTRHFLETFLL